MLQEARLGAQTPRRSRVSSIFQQNTIKQDDIDADFLKHLAFAAQRGSPTAAAPAVSLAEQAADQTTAVEGNDSTASRFTAQSVDSIVPSAAAMQPADTEEFTLAKIEQSIAAIEAELGWTTDAAAPPPVTAVSETKPAAALTGILSTGRPHATSLTASAGIAGTLCLCVSSTVPTSASLTQFIRVSNGSSAPICTTIKCAHQNCLHFGTFSHAAKCCVCWCRVTCCFACTRQEADFHG